jgi:hypothetical protein
MKKNISQKVQIENDDLNRADLLERKRGLRLSLFILTCGTKSVD